MVLLKGVAIYTTYVSSVWVWLYMMSVLLMLARGIMSLLRNILNVEAYPFRSLGVVMFLPMLLVCVAVPQVWGWM